MSYHIFEINPFEQLSFLTSIDRYRDAKQYVRERRSADMLAKGTTYRMMFAATPEQAARLLKEKREPRPMGEHD